MTAIEFKLYPVEALTAGAMAWPWERALEIFTAWREWTALVPDDITSLCRMLQVPDLPDVPAPLRGRQLVVIEAAILGDADMLAPLRALEPELDLFAAMPPAGLIEIHNDPKQPMPGLSDHRLLADVDDATIAALVGAAGPGSGSPLVSVELRHLGGALPIDAASRSSRSASRWTPRRRWRSTPRLARLMAATAAVRRRPRAPELHREVRERADRFFDGYTAAPAARRQGPRGRRRPLRRQPRRSKGGQTPNNSNDRRRAKNNVEGSDPLTITAMGGWRPGRCWWRRVGGPARPRRAGW